jgi:hypothetical protein
MERGGKVKKDFSVQTESCKIGKKDRRLRKKDGKVMFGSGSITSPRYVE